MAVTGIGPLIVGFGTETAERGSRDQNDCDDHNRSTCCCENERPEMAASIHKSSSYLSLVIMWLR